MLMKRTISSVTGLQEFDSLVDRGLKLFNDLDMKRKNTEILEGEVL